MCRTYVRVRALIGALVLKNRQVWLGVYNRAVRQQEIVRLGHQGHLLPTLELADGDHVRRTLLQFSTASCGDFGGQVYDIVILT